MNITSTKNKVTVFLVTLLRFVHNLQILFAFKNGESA